MDAAESSAGWLRLTLVPGVGGESQRKLLKAFGLPEAIFTAGRSALGDVIGDRTARLLLDTDNRAAVDRALAWANGTNQHLVCLADPEYPQALLQIPDPPTLLYVRGRLSLLNQPALASLAAGTPHHRAVATPSASPRPSPKQASASSAVSLSESMRPLIAAR